jgi:hypothetical protein
VAKSFFTVVVSVTLFHLAIVATITVLFCLRGRNVTLGNAWSVVAQLLSPETEIWLAKADGVKDRNVKNWMAAAGKKTMQVGIEEVGEKLQIVRRRV